jgi:hypothetical protein
MPDIESARKIGTTDPVSTASENIFSSGKTRRQVSTQKAERSRVHTNLGNPIEKVHEGRAVAHNRIEGFAEGSAMDVQMPEMDGYVSKPVKLEAILAEISSVTQAPAVK